MRRTYERGTKARLSFSGGAHAPVNMADSMENVGSWTVSGSKEAIEVPKNFKDLQQVGVRNSAIQRSKARNVVWPARESKTRFGATLVSSAHDCELNSLILNTEYEYNNERCK